MAFFKGKVINKCAFFLKQIKKIFIFVLYLENPCKRL